MIDTVTNAGAMPVLERMIQFAARRHELIAGNVANIDTPGYRPVDVSTQAFQQRLGEAIDARRARGPTGGSGGTLNIDSSAEIEITSDGMILHPEPIGANILFHDGNDRALERTMQDLVENFGTFRLAAQLLRHQFESINTAIRERI